MIKGFLLFCISVFITAQSFALSCSSILSTTRYSVKDLRTDISNAIDIPKRYHGYKLKIAGAPFNLIMTSTGFKIKRKRKWFKKTSLRPVSQMSLVEEEYLDLKFKILAQTLSKVSGSSLRFKPAGFVFDTVYPVNFVREKNHLGLSLLQQLAETESQLQSLPGYSPPQPSQFKRKVQKLFQNPVGSSLKFTGAALLKALSLVTFYTARLDPSHINNQKYQNYFKLRASVQAGQRVLYRSLAVLSLAALYSSADDIYRIYHMNSGALYEVFASEDFEDFVNRVDEKEIFIPLDQEATLSVDITSYNEFLSYAPEDTKSPEYEDFKKTAESFKSSLIARGASLRLLDSLSNN